jgi:large subunit ribosomal protein L25
MKLSLFTRTSEKKSEVKKIRREGNIPGVLYGAKHEVRNIYIKGDELQAIFRTLKAGLLSTTVFTLQEGHNSIRAIVKDIHYHPTTYAPQHIDFLALEPNTPVNVNVPIVVLGASECPGIKLGGFSRQPVRSLQVKCLPKDIPQQFSLNIQDLQLTQSKRLSDIEIPESVRPMAKNMNEVAIVIAKR